MSRRTKPTGASRERTPGRVGMDAIRSMPALLSAAEVATITGESTLAVEKNCASGAYPAVKCGRAWRINKERLLQQLGLEEGQEAGEDAGDIVQGSLFMEGKTFDFSSGHRIVTRRQRGENGGDSYVLFTTNGRTKGKAVRVANLSMNPDDARSVADRYGCRVGVVIMPTQRALVIIEGDDRALSKASGKSDKPRMSVSLNRQTDELEEIFGVHYKVFMKMETYDNCFVFRPTGKVIDNSEEAPL